MNSYELSFKQYKRLGNVYINRMPAHQMLPNKTKTTLALNLAKFSYKTYIKYKHIQHYTKLPAPYK